MHTRKTDKHKWTVDGTLLFLVENNKHIRMDSTLLFIYRSRNWSLDNLMRRGSDNRRGLPHRYHRLDKETTHIGLHIPLHGICTQHTVKHSWQQSWTMRTNSRWVLVLVRDGQVTPWSSSCKSDINHNYDPFTTRKNTCIHSNFLYLESQVYRLSFKVKSLVFSATFKTAFSPFPNTSGFEESLKWQYQDKGQTTPGKRPHGIAIQEMDKQCS